MLQFLKYRLKKFLVTNKKKGGRNNQGKITVRHHGGGILKKNTTVDYYRRIIGVNAIVLSLNKDPLRSAHLALIFYKCGILSYIIATYKLKINRVIKSSVTNNLQMNNIACSTFIYNLPLGSKLNNVELYTGQGFALGRSAGVCCKLVNKRVFFNDIEKKIILGFGGLILPSGRFVYVSLNCFASIGRVSNIIHFKTKLLRKKAGAIRNKGIRPTVRGVARNPVDHPHGGGTAGGRSSVSKWGRLTKGGVKTRSFYKNRKYKLYLKKINKSL